MNTTVCICMLTYKRGVLLERALQSLSALRFKKNPDVLLKLILVDNDSAGSGEASYKRLASMFNYPTRYVIEAVQGIASARNRALDEAGKTDFIALLDDDEAADPFWIDELIEVQRTFDADVVGGAVIPIFEDAPSWILKTDFFHSKKQETGAIVRFVETNNVLIRRKYTEEFHFDPRFNTNGGEDTHFFLRLEGAGAKIVWAAEAKVSEFIPRQRTSPEWLIERAEADANRYTRAKLYLYPGLFTRSERLVAALVALVVGTLLVCTSITPRRRVTGLRKMARFLGTIRALFGVSHEYYVQGKVLR